MTEDITETLKGSRGVGESVNLDSVIIGLPLEEKGISPYDQLFREEERLSEKGDIAKLWNNSHLMDIFAITMKEFRKHYFNGSASRYSNVGAVLPEIIHRGF